MNDFILDIPAYLARIGITDPVAADEASLIRLTRAHLEAVPFENLEVKYELREPSLAPQALFSKIVLNRRGGYCFELNKLFYLLLKAIGFSCYNVPCRVVYNREELRPVSHRATIVTVNAHKWFVDVGYGGAGPKGAIRMDTEDVQSIFADDFFVVFDREQEYPGEYVIYRFDNGSPARLITFQDRSWTEADYVTLNSYYATYPRSPFKNRRMLYRCFPWGWISLTDNTLITMKDGIRQTVELQTEQQVQEIIADVFSLYVTPAAEPVPQSTEIHF